MQFFKLLWTFFVMSRKKTQEEFLKELYEKNKHYSDGEFIVVDEYVNNSTKILVKDKYGKLLVSTRVLIRGGYPTIQSAIYKNSYIKNKFKEVHGDTYTYSKIDYVGSTAKINVTCHLHGEFSIRPTNHLKGRGCKQCGIEKCSQAITKTNNQFIKDVIKVHGDRYGFSALNYTKDNANVTLTCEKHGNFDIIANYVIQGGGCQECDKDRRRESSGGWTDTRWTTNGLKSKNFHSFKVYIIRCWDDVEEFYKIGKTYLSLKSRFNCKSKMPYQYEVIKIFEYKKNGVKISKLERQLHLENKEHKYVPKTEFKGMYECFSKINEETLAYELN